jgi:hypothetical protein
MLRRRELYTPYTSPSSHTAQAQALRHCKLPTGEAVLLATAVAMIGTRACTAPLSSAVLSAAELDRQDSASTAPVGGRSSSCACTATTSHHAPIRCPLLPCAPVSFYCISSNATAKARVMLPRFSNTQRDVAMQCPLEILQQCWRRRCRCRACHVFKDQRGGGSTLWRR